MNTDSRYLRKRPPRPSDEWMAAIEAANARRRREFQPPMFTESTGRTYPITAVTHHRRKVAAHERIFE